MKRIILGLIMAATLASGGAWADSPDFGKMLASIDQKTDFKDTDFSAVVQLKSQDPDNGNNDTTVAMFRRDRTDQFVLLILAPESKKGQGYLKLADNFWSYDPTSRKFSFSSLKDNFDNSDAKNSDFQKTTWAKDYTVTAQAEGKLGKYETWILDLTATNTGVSYPKKKVWIDKSAVQILKTEDYSLSGKLLRTSLYPSYTVVGGKSVATKSIFIDALVANKRTEITLSDVSVKVLDSEVFSKAFLEKVNK